MLNEGRIAELMRTNERPHTMLDDERARIRHVLDQSDEPGFDDHAGRLVDVSVDEPSAGRRRRRGPALLLAAAVTVLIAGLALTLSSNQERPVSIVADAPQSSAETQTPLPAPDPLRIDLQAGEAFCAGSFSDLAEAIAGWDGITNWSYLTDGRNPEPHIPTVITAVLDDLAAIIDEDELKMSRAELADALSQAESQPAGFTPEIRAVVANALTSVVDSVGAILEADVEAGFVRFSACDLSTFTAE